MMDPGVPVRHYASPFGGEYAHEIAPAGIARRSRGKPVRPGWHAPSRLGACHQQTWLGVASFVLADVVVCAARGTPVWPVVSGGVLGRPVVNIRVIAGWFVPNFDAGADETALIGGGEHPVHRLRWYRTGGIELRA
jgi:hypothetical protein